MTKMTLKLNRIKICLKKKLTKTLENYHTKKALSLVALSSANGKD